MTINNIYDWHDMNTKDLEEIKKITFFNYNTILGFIWRCGHHYYLQHIF